MADRPPVDLRAGPVAAAAVTEQQRLRQRYEEARDAKPGTYPPRSPGESEARARYWEWRASLTVDQEAEYLAGRKRARL